MENDKVVILADKNVAAFLSELDEPIKRNENLFILNKELGTLIKTLVKEKGLDNVVKILREGIYEKEKIINRSVF